MASTPLTHGPLRAQQAHSRQPEPASATPSSSRRAHSDRDQARRPLPLITHPWGPNPTSTSASSTSVVPQTAEGKAIPVDGATAENRTLALREINNQFPSRQRCTNPKNDAQSGISEPVVVRTYYAPAQPPRPRRHDAATYSGVASKAGATAIGAARRLAFASHLSLSPAARTSSTNYTTYYTGKAPALDVCQDQGTHLPPIKAFTFKSFMAHSEAHSGPDDINADLDRIAEICARSRYCLSDQYEVHYTPRGSRVTFHATGSHQEPRDGPALPFQVVPLRNSNGQQDMQHNFAMPNHRRRRRFGRMSSRAVGTLETIVSVSRSSEEDDAERKAATATQKESSGPSSPRAASPLAGREMSDSKDETRPPLLGRRHSTSLALIEPSRQSRSASDPTAFRAASSALVSEPALPQASARQLETRTASSVARPVKAQGYHYHARVLSAPLATSRDARFVRGSISPVHHQDIPGKAVLSSISGWLPWTSASAVPPGRAESSLRYLLQTTEHKAKRTAGVMT
ncbi:hypothetical protein E4U17_005050 [Claviceps sp. LM77 group G4]|nr:hypothetical protein E4U17_005050 [Claviceps sp. LM77 group G4]KAG6053316.1 hypothetical protein E4U33_000243 [Claviceps sp. LM78 group G4]KAG6083600.1 hypothetical protein E4U16_003862 [Claviceps sp. LM84 group G4]